MRKVVYALLALGVTLLLFSAKPIPVPQIEVDVVPDMVEVRCSNFTDGTNLAVLTANVTGNYIGPLGFQWTEDGVDIPGAINSTIELRKTSPQRHEYNCKVQDLAYPHTLIFTDPKGVFVNWERCPIILWWRELK